MQRDLADLKARLSMAQSTNIELDILEKLANDSSRKVRQAIALNPNTPVNLLEQLSSDFPEEVVQNPAFEQFSIDNPGSIFVRTLLSRSRTTGAEQLIKLFNVWVDGEDIKLLLAIVCNPNAPLPFLGQQLVEHNGYKKVRISLAGCAIPSVLLGSFFEICQNYEDFDLLLEIAGNPNTPIPILTKMRSCPNVLVTIFEGTMDHSDSDYRQICLLNAALKNNKTLEQHLSTLSGSLS